MAANIDIFEILARQTAPAGSKLFNQTPDNKQELIEAVEHLQRLCQRIHSGNASHLAGNIANGLQYIKELIKK